MKVSVMHTSTMRLTDAQRQLVVENLGLINFAISRYGSQGLAYTDDLFQIGAIGLMKAARLYDDQKAQFSTYAVHSILNELRSERRLQRAQRHGSGYQVVSLDAPIRDGGRLDLQELLVGSEPDIDEQLIYADLARYVHELFAKPTRENDMVKELLLSGATQTEIANRYGISQARVSQCVQRALRILRKRLTDCGEVGP